ncbi:protein canopy-1 [Chanos chanos]|uniref:Protein canopy-1 n=1 Tax=Chanos chanos TaxID=29144 RepID=A0A6J2VEJ4_CHACN|nr:protein canopy-1-like [Chanos chanos]
MFSISTDNIVGNFYLTHVTQKDEDSLSDAFVIPFIVAKFTPLCQRHYSGPRYPRAKVLCSLAHLLLFVHILHKQEGRMARWIIPAGLMLLAVFIFCETTEGKKDKMVYCSACMAIADEMNYSISQIDPKKTLHVGGFRVSPDGSLMEKKIPLARSETQLSELLEDVCERMNDYAIYEDPDTKQSRYKRFAPRGNDNLNFPDFKNFKFDGPDASSALKFACENIVEEYEDDIISLFSKETKHVAQKLCNEVSGHCKGSESHGEL